jgi:uncharacterized membrane protein
MSPEVSVPPASPSDPDGKSTDASVDQIGQNIETILAFYTREEKKISRAQRVLENISRFAGRPLYLVLILLFVALWILANVVAHGYGMAEFDPAPFFWLQGVLGLGALLTATVVLIKQDRLAKLEERRADLDLQVNLLTEQKTTKLIELIEELRRDLPMVKDRHDPKAAALQQPTDPHQVLAAIDERRDSDERFKAAADGKEAKGK